MIKLKPGLAAARTFTAHAVAAARKRVRLACPVAAQWSGIGAAIAGVFLLAGLAWALLIGGVALFVIGVLAEGGKL